MDKNGRRRYREDSRRGTVEILRLEPIPGAVGEIERDMVTARGAEGSLRLVVRAGKGVAT